MPPGKLIQGAAHTTEDEDDELELTEELDDVELDTEDIDELDDVVEDDELTEDVEFEALELDDEIDDPGALAIDDAFEVATFLPPVHAASNKVTQTESIRRLMYISSSQ